MLINYCLPWLQGRFAKEPSTQQTMCKKSSVVQCWAPRWKGAVGCFRKADTSFSAKEELNISKRSGSFSAAMAGSWASFNWKWNPTKELKQDTHSGYGAMSSLKEEVMYKPLTCIQFLPATSSKQRMEETRFAFSQLNQQWVAENSWDFSGPFQAAQHRSLL